MDEKTKNERKERLKKITDQLEQGITDLFESGKYQEWLNVMSRFHHYSYNNSILILMQRPDAEQVAGFTTWKSMDRNIKKGEKAIRILAPAPYKITVEEYEKDLNGNIKMGVDGKPIIKKVERQMVSFKPVSVFDVSQTEGKELPKLAERLTGDIEEYEAFVECLKNVAPVPVNFEDIQGGANGYFSPMEQKIVVRTGLSQMHTIKTLIHEITHSKLHDVINIEDVLSHKDRRTKEVEAESVAYTVCKHYGIDTSDYSFGYVAGWSKGKELEELKKSLETIRDTAFEIINDVESYFKELDKGKDKELSTVTNKEQEAVITQPKKKTKCR